MVILSSLVDLAQGLHDQPRIARIERCDGLIGEDQLGILDQGAGNGHALLLAAGQRIGALQRLRQQVEPVERQRRGGTVGGREVLEHDRQVPR